MVSNSSLDYSLDYPHVLMLDEHQTLERGSNEDTNEDDLQLVLASWGLSHLNSVLKRFKINFNMLPYISLIDIDSIFKTDEELGNKIMFRTKLNEWRKENSYPLLDQVSSSTVTGSLNNQDITNWLQTSTRPLEAEVKDNKNDFIFEKFMQSASGKKILDIYNSQNPPNLTPEGRRYLVDSIIQEFMAKDICMDNEEFKKITNLIIKTFPSEKGDYYFKPSNEQQKYASGVLYNKYRNCSSRLRKHGIFQSRKRRRSSVSNDRSSITSTESQQDSQQDEQFLSDKNWLSCYHEPWETVEIKWKATSIGRRSEISNLEAANKTIKFFLDDWRLFTSANGFRLVDIDFECRYKEQSMSLMINWPAFVELAPTILTKHIKDARCKKEILSLNNINDIDTKNLKLLKLLHYALPPTSRVSKIVNKKKFWKPSIEDSISSFILHVNSHDAIEIKLSKVKSKYAEYNLKLQPLIIVVGEENAPKEYVTVFDGILYKFDHILSAVDCCFKLFFVFGIKYPLESSKIWLFFQHYFYKIITEYDVSDTKLIVFLSDLHAVV